MKTGRLRHFVELERYCTERDELGQPFKEWQRHAIGYGSLDAITGKEGFDSSRLSTETTLKAKVRWSPQMAEATTKDQIIVGGCRYEITGIIPSNNTQTEIVFLVSRFEDGRH